MNWHRVISWIYFMWKKAKLKSIQSTPFCIKKGEIRKQTLSTYLSNIDYYRVWDPIEWVGKNRGNKFFWIYLYIHLDFGTMLLFCLLREIDKINKDTVKLNTNRSKWIELCFQWTTQPHWWRGAELTQITFKHSIWTGEKALNKCEL